MRRWQKRALAARHYVRGWAEGTDLQAGIELAAECMPLMTNAKPAGRRERLEFQVGVRESAQSWRGLLIDLMAAGLPARQSRAEGEARDRQVPCFLSLRIILDEGTDVPADPLLL